MAHTKNYGLPFLLVLLVLLHLIATTWALVDITVVRVVGRIQLPAILLFSLLHAGKTLGWRRTLLFFLLSATISWGFEQVGVASGWVYGNYHYSAKLGFKLGYVPLIIPFIWFTMLYPSYTIANLIGSGRFQPRHSSFGQIIWLSVLGAMTMTAWDLAIDPIFTKLGFWIWEDGGPYFGVPLHNFGGWLLTTFTIFLVYRVWERQWQTKLSLPVTPFIGWLPPLIYGSQALATFMRPDLGIISFFAMGFPVLAAVASYRVRQATLESM